MEKKIEPKTKLIAFRTTETIDLKLNLEATKGNQSKSSIIELAIKLLFKKRGV